MRSVCFRPLLRGVDSCYLSRRFVRRSCDESGAVAGRKLFHLCSPGARICRSPSVPRSWFRSPLSIPASRRSGASSNTSALLLKRCGPASWTRSSHRCAPSRCRFCARRVRIVADNTESIFQPLGHSECNHSGEAECKKAQAHEVRPQRRRTCARESSDCRLVYLCPLARAITCTRCTVGTRILFGIRE